MDLADLEAEVQSPQKKKIQGVATLWVERIHIHIQTGTSENHHRLRSAVC